MIVLALVAGCVPHARGISVEYGPAEPIPLVHTSRDPRRWYVPMEGDEPSVWFVDTGYDVTHCDDAFAHRLDLQTAGRVRVRGELGTIAARRARLPPVTIGGHEVRGVRCLVRDIGSTSSIRDPEEVPVAGVLGMDVLRQFRMVLDPASGTLSLFDPNDAPPLPSDAPDVARIRTSMVSSRVQVSLDVGEERVWTLLDTGASRTHIDGLRMGLTRSTTESVVVRGTGVRNDAVRSIDIFRVAPQVAGQLAPTTELLQRTHRPGQRGPRALLGLDLLRGFHQDYDFRRRRVRITPVRPRPLPTWERWATDGHTEGALRLVPRSPPAPAPRR